jgi:hypothetical protein
MKLSLFRFIPPFCLILGVAATALGCSNPLKTCVFSSVKAQLTIEGEPVKGATVIRRWDWQKQREDRTVTDESGYFEFPARFEYSVLRLLPAEIVIGQGLYVLLEGEEKAFWTNARRDPEENAEYQGHPIDIVCDLRDEEVLIKEFGARMVTLCILNQ